MMSGVKPLAWPAEMVPEDPDRHAEHRRTDRAADNPGNRRIEADMFLDPLVGLVAQGLIPVRLGCDQTRIACSASGYWLRISGSNSRRIQFRRKRMD